MSRQGWSWHNGCTLEVQNVEGEAMMKMTRRLLRAKRGQRGVAAVEFAIVLPVLLVLALGTASLAHASILRFLLSSAAYDAARICALQRDSTAGCAQAVVTNKLKDSLKWCNGFTVGAATKSEANDPANGEALVRSLTVEIGCGFNGGVGLGFLAANQVVVKELRVRAVMPY